MPEENGDLKKKIRRFNFGRMGLAYIIVVGMMFTANVLLFQRPEEAEKLDPNVIWMSISNLAVGVIAYYFGFRQGQQQGQPPTNR